jgi:pimeloyl-ACP methyl ester carboxylesterase
MIQVHSHTSLIPNSTKAIVTLAAICSLSLAACSVTALGEESHFIRHSDKAPGIIVFVHGLFGDSVSTWTNKDTKAYFPKLLTQDPIFDGWNIYAVQYPSPIINSTLSIDELADTVRSDLESIDLLGYDNVVFISHSLGGLVTRAFLTK